MKNMIIISSKKNPFYIRQRYNSLIWLEQRVISDPGGMYNNFLYTHQIAGFMLNYWVQATSNHSILHRKICKMLKKFFFFCKSVPFVNKSFNNFSQQLSTHGIIMSINC